MEKPIWIKMARFRMRPGISVSNVKCISEGGSWIHRDAIRFMSIPLHDKYEINLNIGFPEDLSKWDDFNYILVSDEDFGQPYVPFYAYMDGTWKKKSSILTQIIQKYNEEMRALPFLEEIKE